MRPLGAVAAALVVGLLVACSNEAGAGARPKVATTVYPVEFVAQAITGERADVVNIVPAGAEPHDVELGAGQVIELVDADLVIYLGGGFQSAVEEAIRDAEGITLDALAELGPAGGASESDAHFWLDPMRLANLATVLGDRLGRIDPASRATYRAAADDLRARLTNLDHRFRAGLADCSEDEIVTTHGAFGYLASAYGLTQTSIAGVDPEAEPSPNRIAELIDFVRARDISAVFAEPLLPQEAAETLARESGAEVLTLDPLESAPQDGDYIAAMERNLAQLRTGLDCA